MDFSFTEEQNMVTATVKDFILKEYPIEKLREFREKNKKEFDPDMWKKMAELGWMGLAIPEEYSGSGLGFFDLAIVMEEMGRGLLHSPFYSTVGEASLPLLKFGSAKQKKDYLPGIAAEGAIWSFAFMEKRGEYSIEEVKMTAKLSGTSYVLNGTKTMVPYAHVANYILVAAKTSAKGITVFIVDAKSEGVETELIPTLAHDGKCQVRFNKVKVPKANILGKLDKGWAVVDYIIQDASILKCAEMSGAVQASHALSNQYAKDRIQFDVPIGSFQAIQFKLVDMLVKMDALKYLVWEAAWKISIGESDRMLNSIVKVRANDVYEEINQNGIEIHAAIGFTDEMDLAQYIVNTKAFEFTLGGSDLHLERIAQELENYKPDFLKK